MNTAFVSDPYYTAVPTPGYAEVIGFDEQGRARARLAYNDRQVVILLKKTNLYGTPYEYEIGDKVLLIQQNHSAWY